MVEDESNKIRNMLMTKKTKFLLYPVKQQKKKKIVLKKINCPKNNIIIF